MCLCIEFYALHESKNENAQNDTHTVPKEQMLEIIADSLGAGESMRFMRSEQKLTQKGSIKFIWLSINK